MSGRRGISRKSLSSPLGKFATFCWAKTGYTTTIKPCEFDIILPKELRPLSCQGKKVFLGVIKKSCVWVVTHRTTIVYFIRLELIFLVQYVIVLVVVYLSLNSYLFVSVSALFVPSIAISMRLVCSLALPFLCVRVVLCTSV